VVRRFLRHAEATSAIEFALTSPLLFALIFGIFEFGWAFHCGASVRAAVTRETRLLIANPATTAAQFEQAVKTDLANIADPKVKISFADEAIGTGSVTRISWTYAHAILFPFLPDVTLNLSSSTLVPKSS
jgi:Flp pilus assembly protein TadG